MASEPIDSFTQIHLHIYHHTNYKYYCNPINAVLSNTNSNSVTYILYTVTQITDILYSIQFTALSDHNIN